MFMTRCDVRKDEVAFTRLQFPVRLAYTMTFNKSQGQTMDRIGIVLKSHPFVHGQTYVALSGVRSFEAVKMRNCNAENPKEMRNIVYKHVLY